MERVRVEIAFDSHRPASRYSHYARFFEVWYGMLVACNSHPFRMIATSHYPHSKIFLPKKRWQVKDTPLALAGNHLGADIPSLYFHITGRERSLKNGWSLVGGWHSLRYQMKYRGSLTPTRSSQQRPSASRQRHRITIPSTQRSAVNHLAPLA